MTIIDLFGVRDKKYEKSFFSSLSSFRVVLKMPIIDIQSKRQGAKKGRKKDGFLKKPKIFQPTLKSVF